jgi:hypothetical protein
VADYGTIYNYGACFSRKNGENGEEMGKNHGI